MRELKYPTEKDVIELAALVNEGRIEHALDYTDFVVDDAYWAGFEYGNERCNELFYPFGEPETIKDYSSLSDVCNAICDNIDNMHRQDAKDQVRQLIRYVREHVKLPLTEAQQHAKRAVVV